jgi:hypothetical protein
MTASLAEALQEVTRFVIVSVRGEVVTFRGNETSITAHKFNEMMRGEVVYPNVRCIRSDTHSNYVMPITGFGNFPNVEHLKMLHTFRVTVPADGRVAFQELCPHLIQLCIPGLLCVFERALTLTLTGFYAQRVDVTVPSSTEFLSGNSTCKFTNLHQLPRLSKLSAFIFEDTVVPVGLSDLFIVGTEAPVSIEASRMERLSGNHNHPVKVTSVCPLLKIVHLSGRVAFEEAVPVEYLMCENETEFDLARFPNLFYVSLPDTERYGTSLRDRDVFVSPTSLAVRCGRPSFGYRFNRVTFDADEVVSLAVGWTTEAYPETNRFQDFCVDEDSDEEEESEEESVYEPGCGAAVALDPAEEIQSEGEQETKEECLICVEKMTHPRSPYECDHALCHACARVQKCPFCRSAKRKLIM